MSRSENTAQCIHVWDDCLYDQSRYECTKCRHWLTTVELNAFEDLLGVAKRILTRELELDAILKKRYLYNGYTLTREEWDIMALYDAVQKIERERR